MRPTDFDRLAVIKLFFPFVWLSLTHPVTYTCDTCTSTSMYCLSFYIYHLSAQQLLSCDLSVLPSPQRSYRHNWNHWNFIGAYWKGLDWIVFSDKKGLAKKIKENWIKLKLKKNVSYSSFFVTLFYFIFSPFFALQNLCFLILYIMLPFIMSSKNFHPYFISLTLPNQNLFWRHHVLTSPDLRGMTEVPWWEFSLLSTTSQLWMGQFPMFWCS